MKVLKLLWGFPQLKKLGSGYPLNLFCGQIFDNFSFIAAKKDIASIPKPPIFRFKLYGDSFSTYSFLIFVFFSLLSCENKLEDVDAVSSQKNKIMVETSKDILVTYSDSAEIKAILKSPLFKNYKSDDPYYEMPIGLEINFFSKGEKESKSKLTANYGIRREKKKLMEVRNNVVVINNKGEKLNTEKLIWNELTQKIYSDEFVKVTQKDKIIYGDGFESDQSFTKYRIFKIKGVINLKEGQFVP